jgi:hypothetical protein
MDVCVFGVLKRRLGKLCGEAMRACQGRAGRGGAGQGRAWGKADAVRAIVEACAEIDANVIKRA